MKYDNLRKTDTTFSAQGLVFSFPVVTIALTGCRKSSDVASASHIIFEIP